MLQKLLLILFLLCIGQPMLPLTAYAEEIEGAPKLILLWTQRYGVTSEDGWVFASAKQFGKSGLESTPFIGQFDGKVVALQSRAAGLINEAGENSSKAGRAWRIVSMGQNSFEASGPIYGTSPIALLHDDSIVWFACANHNSTEVLIFKVSLTGMIVRQCMELTGAADFGGIDRLWIAAHSERPSLLVIATPPGDHLESFSWLLGPESVVNSFDAAHVPITQWSGRVEPGSFVEFGINGMIYVRPPIKGFPQVLRSYRISGDRVVPASERSLIEPTIPDKFQDLSIVGLESYALGHRLDCMLNLTLIESPKWLEVGAAWIQFFGAEELGKTPLIMPDLVPVATANWEEFRDSLIALGDGHEAITTSFGNEPLAIGSFNGRGINIWRYEPEKKLVQVVGDIQFSESDIAFFEEVKNSELTALRSVKFWLPPISESESRVFGFATKDGLQVWTEVLVGAIVENYAEKHEICEGEGIQ